MGLKRTLSLTLGLAMAGSFAFAQNVGIGTAAPAERLHVAGSIRSDALAGAVTRVVGADANGTLVIIGPGTSGDVLTTDGTGAAVWQAPANDGDDWLLLGNAGTNPATNFIGTTDNVTFVTRTNNLERMRVTNGGQVSVNFATPFAGDVFTSVSAGTDFAINGYSVGTGAAGFFNNQATGDAAVGIASGTAGNAAELQITDAANGSSGLFIVNGGAGLGINNINTANTNWYC